MPAPPKHLQGADRIVNAFGYWPSFHDANLRDVHHDEAGSGMVTFILQAFEITNETYEAVNPRGEVCRYFRLTKHHDVRFRFDDVTVVSIPTQGDTLDILQISDERDADGRFLVLLDSVIGCPYEGFGGSFRARSGLVVDIVPTETNST